MRISPTHIKKLCHERGLSLNTLLKQAGVSKTAYYSLTNRALVVPITVLRLCKTLGVNPSVILEPLDNATITVKLLQHKLEQLVRTNPLADRDNIWHTLVLLDEAPSQRLNRALQRGQGMRSK